ncbi:unnamed protein product [Clonostachys rosea]|uniref:1,3-beta-glucanosyltransferase n=1 Tax=Bionectria ochroleuca TaxID=29856 RepID=A0ABY6UZT4_BIOOC|nr:unnamed protein product [Clonostachys rosea]
MFLQPILYTGLISACLALPNPSPPFEPPHDVKFPENAKCGEVNVFYTSGFTAYHPYVIEQGLDPHAVDHDLRTSVADLVKAGFNVRVLFQGPEQPLANLEDRLKHRQWDITAEGFGIRGYRNGTASKRFEDNLYLLQQYAPHAPSVFNWGGPTLAESVTRRVPLTEDCSDKPGDLIAYEEICAPDVCQKTTTVLNGNLTQLLGGI